MHAACFLKNNHTIVIIASYLVRNVVLNYKTHSIVSCMALSMQARRPAGVLPHTEKEMFVCIAPCRELET
jgi:hypothetical protein